MDRIGPKKCKVCRGGECRGGGNKRCLQRERQPCVLTGVLDHYGCLRFVVCTANAIGAHLRSDETAITVPDLTVHQPIAWGDIPSVIARIELEVNRFIERGLPNEPHVREAVIMYRLRQLEQNRHSLDLNSIVET